MVNLVSGVVFFQANFTILKNSLSEDKQFRLSQLTDLTHNMARIDKKKL